MQKNLLDSMHQSLGKLLPAFEIEAKAELVAEINQLKHQKNAVILGHNYMEAALYNFVADIRGDSLALCHQAQQSTCDIILFCGVYFMAETAKILNPSRKVLIPSLQAGCSLAASITADDVRTMREHYPNVPIVTYINTYAEVKAEADICCTSSNASRIINDLDSESVIFIPDEYLACNVAHETGRRVIFPYEKAGKNTLIAWRGKCEVHELFSVDDIEAVKRQLPTAQVLAHPECSPEVVAAADFSGSTSQMVDYVRDNDHPLLLLTECSMADNVIAENPQRQENVLRLCSIRCPHMNQITLEQTRDALLYDRYQVTIDEALRRRAAKSIERMLA